MTFPEVLAPGADDVFRGNAEERLENIDGFELVRQMVLAFRGAEAPPELLGPKNPRLGGSLVWSSGDRSALRRLSLRF